MNPVVCMMSRVARSELRVHSPLESFPDAERERWAAYVASGRRAPDLRDESPAGWADLDRLLDTAERGDAEAYVIVRGAQEFVCPRRLDLRAIGGLLGFRRSVPTPLAETILPAADARRVAAEWDRLRARHPERRSHVLSSAWQVPPYWFAAVDESERRYEVDAHGVARLSYETLCSMASERLAFAVDATNDARLGEALPTGLKGLAEWVEAFEPRSVLQLDYGTVADLFSSEALADDHSARDVASALQALSRGDLVRSGSSYAALNERWKSAGGLASLS